MPSAFTWRRRVGREHPEWVCLPLNGAEELAQGRVGLRLSQLALLVKTPGPSPPNPGPRWAFLPSAPPATHAAHSPEGLAPSPQDFPPSPGLGLSDGHMPPWRAVACVFPQPQRGKTCSLSCFKAQSPLSGSPRKLRLPAQDRAGSFMQLG